MFNVSFFQFLIFIFLIFLLFGDFNKVLFNFNKIKAYVSEKMSPKE